MRCDSTGLRWGKKGDRMEKPGLLAGLTLTIQLDSDQYRTIIHKLDELRDLILSTVDDPQKVAALTAQLKKSGDALRSVVEGIPQQP